MAYFSNFHINNTLNTCSFFKFLCVFFLLVITLFLFQSQTITAIAQTSSSPINIVAIVNDDAISDYDLNMRLKLALVSSELEDTPANRAKIQEQVLDAMIEERLKKQEAERNNIKNTPEELSHALANIEAQNNLPSGGLYEKLQQHNISYDTIRNQIDSDLSWLKVIKFTLWNKVNISNKEVTEALAKTKFIPIDETLLNISEIFIPVTTMEQESQAYAQALSILEELNKGESFSLLATNFSRSPSAMLGGDLGWVPEKSLNEELTQSISNLSKNQFSYPIKTKEGYYIILLKDRKLSSTTRQLELAKATVPNDYKAQNPDFLSLLLSEQTCDSFISTGKKANIEGTGKLEPTLLSALPDVVQKALENKKQGEISAPVIMSDRELYFFICKDMSGQSEEFGIPSFDKVKSMLENQAADALGKRKLRDLKNSAIIDKRLP